MNIVLSSCSHEHLVTLKFEPKEVVVGDHYSGKDASLTSMSIIFHVDRDGLLEVARTRKRGLMVKKDGSVGRQPYVDHYGGAVIKFLPEQIRDAAFAEARRLHSECTRGVPESDEVLSLTASDS